MKRFKRILVVWNKETPVTALFSWSRQLAEASSAQGVDGLWCRDAMIPEYPRAGASSDGVDRGGDALLAAMEGLPVQVIVEEGDPLRATLKRLADGSYDLVIVSAHDTASRNLAERIARKSPVGVLVLPPGATVPPEIVRLGVDLSDISALCLDWAEAFATLKPEGGADLEVVHVMERLQGGRATLVLDSDSIYDQMAEIAGDQLAEFIAKHSRDPEKWGHVLLENQSASEVLMRRVGDPASELTVVGCHGRNALSIALLGSHACDMVRRCESPVLVVKSGNQNLGFLRQLLGEEG